MSPHPLLIGRPRKSRAAGCLTVSDVPKRSLGQFRNTAAIALLFLRQRALLGQSHNATAFLFLGGGGGSVRGAGSGGSASAWMCASVPIQLPSSINWAAIFSGGIETWSCSACEGARGIRVQRKGKQEGAQGRGCSEPGSRSRVAASCLCQ